MTENTKRVETEKVVTCGNCPNIEEPNEFQITTCWLFNRSLNVVEDSFKRLDICRAWKRDVANEEPHNHITLEA
jgi:hypothetical protein